ncbi:MAG: sensor histidine kinase [Acidimicrobiales bacterium]
MSAWARPRSLRTRLIAGVLLLVAVALLATDLVTSSELRSFLLKRVDQQLVRSEAGATRRLAISAGLLPLSPLNPEVVPLPQVRSRLDVFRSDIFAEVIDADGAVLLQLPSGQPGRADPPPRLPKPSTLLRGGGRPFTVGAQSDAGLRFRVLALPVGSGGMVVLAQPLRDVEQTLAHLRRIETVVTVVALMGLALLGVWWVQLGLRPLGEVAATADAIAAGDLSHRVARVDADTEVGRLGLAFNSMLGRIEQAFADRQASEDRLRRFVADASHELRTPLTSIRGYAELFRRGAADRPVDLERAMSRIEEESTRMGLLVEDLLLLARLDQGRPLESQPVDLARVAMDAVDDARAVEPERPIVLTVQPSGGPVMVRGDEHRLRQVMANLLANVRVHTPPGVAVEVDVRATADRGVVLEVADHGPGMAPEVAERAFERFYRADPSRARVHGGTGLGLSIVAAIAEAHGGRASAQTSLGEGCRIRVELPGAGVDGPEPPGGAVAADARPAAGPAGSEAQPAAGPAGSEAQPAAGPAGSGFDARPVVTDVGGGGA